MDEILNELQKIKTQQLALNNLILEQAKQNEMIFVVLKKLLVAWETKKNRDKDI